MPPLTASAPPLQELELSHAPHIHVQAPSDPPAYGAGEGKDHSFHFPAFQQQQQQGAGEQEQKQPDPRAGVQESGEPEVYVIHPSPAVRDDFSQNDSSRRDNQEYSTAGYAAARSAALSSPSPPPAADSGGRLAAAGEDFGFAALRAKLKKDPEQEFEDIEPGAEAPEILVTENGSRFVKHKAHRDDDLNKLAIHYRTTIADIRKSVFE